MNRSKWAAGLLLIVLAVPLGGCIPLLVAPAVKFTTSETQGGLGKGTVAVGASRGPNMSLFEDEASVPQRTTRNFSHENVTSGALAIGVHRRVDLEVIRNDAGDDRLVPSLVRAKFQLTGEPASTARRGNSSFALMLGGGRATVSPRDVTAGFNGPVSPAVTVDAETWMYEGGIIAAHRLANWLLAYGSVSASHYEFESSSGARADFLFDGTLRQLALNAGVEAGAGFFVFRVEGGAAQNSSAGKQKWEPVLGLQLGARWR